jgi:hypothetical protein
MHIKRSAAGNGNDNAHFDESLKKLPPPEVVSSKQREIYCAQDEKGSIPDCYNANSFQARLNSEKSDAGPPPPLGVDDAIHH